MKISTRKQAAILKCNITFTQVNQSRFIWNTVVSMKMEQMSEIFIGVGMKIHAVTTFTHVWCFIKNYSLF